ncbi:peroxisomal assembly protein [Coemansia erecta]|uniref:Peroxisomal ATPase PEX6 n=1 Tax=Coemansia erecta TaxID=147472 RepID=A0A9W7Y7B4_9FUNG|nr:peroxisomal assembly protein [Coemansia erecta]
MCVERVYASIKTDGCSGSSGKPCIVEVAEGIQDDKDSLVCLASGSVWSVVGANIDCLDEEDNFGPHSVAAALEVVVPVELSEIVFGVSSSQYDAALAAQDTIAAQIREQSRLYYEGYQISVATSEDSHELVTLQCLMCQPVSQGIVYSNSSNTRIILVKSLSAEDSSATDDQVAEPSTEDNVLDIDQWDIGAEWLILGDAPSLENRDRHVEVSAVPLAIPVDNAQLVPAAYPSEDYSNRGYMSLAALAKTGIVSGGWILVSSLAISEESPESSGTSTLHTYLSHSDGAARSKTNTNHQPPFETARKVVLARVSSPLSERKDLEAHALAALQRWLSPDPLSEDAKDGSVPLRVIKTGDLIVVRIELSEANMRTNIALMAGADMANRVRSGDPNAAPDAIDVNPVTDLALEMLDGQDSSTHEADADGLVFFRVDSVEGFKRGRAAYGLGSVMESERNYDGRDYDSNGSDSDDDDDDDEALAQASNAPPGQENADDLPISRVLRKCIEDVSKAHKDTGFPVVVVASSNQPDKIPASLAAAFRYEIELGVPDERTRLMLLKSTVRSNLPLAPDADIAYVAQQTASFVARDLATLVRRAESHAWKRAQKKAPAAAAAPNQPDTSSRLPLEIRDLVVSGQTITNDDLLEALGDARASMSDTLGVPKIPNVKWDDVGGLADAKKDILDTIRLPMEQPHLFASGLSTRSGLLFYGPPGTGKTLLAKAIATECGLNFFSCKGPELISPYIGESEANVRRIFQKAREASPCVIFFDELDSLAPKRGQQGDSGGVMDRIVSQLLAELDGMSSNGDSRNNDADNADEKSNQKTAGDNSPASAVQVFAIGATNRPDLLDPALLRPGRFDKLVYLGVSETHEAQQNIIQALTRKFHLHPDLDLRLVSEKCPFHYTGADFYALCSDALLKAMLRTVDEVDELIKQWNSDDTREQNDEHPVPMTPQYYLDHIAAESLKQVTVTAGDFHKALDELIPSVSAEELVRYQALRQQFDSALKGKDKQTDEAPTTFESDDRSQYPENQFQSHGAKEGTGIESGPSASSQTDSKKKAKGKDKGKGKAPVQ